MGETADSGKKEAKGEEKGKHEKKEKHDDADGKEEKEEKIKEKKKKDKDGKSMEDKENGGKEKKKNPLDKMDAGKLKLKLEKIDTKMKDLAAKREEILKLLSEAEKNAANPSGEAAPTPSS